MNVEKAREHFSAYYEKSLEPGLVSQLERAMVADAAIRAEYRAFEQACEAIHALQNEPVELPWDLHERISARLDKHVWEQERAKPKGIVAWWRTLALGGVAALGIFGAGMAILNKNSSDYAGANVVPVTVASAPTPRVIAKGGEWILTLPASKEVSLKVVEFASQKPVLERKLMNQPVESPLKVNETSLLKISAQRGSDVKELIVAVPGGITAVETKGTGTVRDLALRAASYYRVPVSVKVKDFDQSVTFELSGKSPSEAPNSKIGEFALELREGVLILMDAGQR